MVTCACDPTLSPPASAESSEKSKRPSAPSIAATRKPNPAKKP